MRGALLALLLVAPGALALDAFPDEARVGAHDARFLVRLPEGGTIRLRADPQVELAVVAPGEDATAYSASPVDFPVSTTTTWHGLPGTVDIVARRADASRPVTIEADDGSGGAVMEWPAIEEPPARWVPWPGALALVGIVGVLAAARAPSRHPRR